MKLEWYAYRHVNGTIHLKRYFDKFDISETRASFFVAEVTGPFECSKKNDALDIATARLGSGNRSQN